MNKITGKIISALRVNTLIGLFLLAPLVGTLWIFYFLITFVSNHIVPAALLATDYSVLFRIGAIVVVLAVLYFVGLLTRNFIGRRVYHLIDKLLANIPVINSVYTSIRQISEAVANTQSTLFKEVVAVQFPRQGLYSLGFVTNRAPETIARKIDPGNNDMICVFVPTTPNPTTGFFLIMPRAEVIYLDINVASAMKMVISAGAALPWQDEKASRLTLLDYIEAWVKRGENSASNQPAEKNRDKPEKR